MRSECLEAVDMKDSGIGYYDTHTENFAVKYICNYPLYTNSDGVTVCKKCQPVTDYASVVVLFTIIYLICLSLTIGYIVHQRRLKRRNSSM